MGYMKAARLENSKRLQDAFWLLADGLEHSTREISRALDRFAINSIIDELRDVKRTDNGLDIKCKQRGSSWWYRMERDAKFFEWRLRLTKLAAKEVA